MKSAYQFDKKPGEFKSFDSVVKRVYFNYSLEDDLQQFLNNFNFMPPSKRVTNQMLYDLAFINNKHGTDYKVLHFFSLN